MWLDPRHKRGASQTGTCHDAGRSSCGAGSPNPQTRNIHRAPAPTHRRAEGQRPADNGGGKQNRRIFCPRGRGVEAAARRLGAAEGRVILTTVTNRPFGRRHAERCSVRCERTTPAPSAVAQASREPAWLPGACARKAGSYRGWNEKTHDELRGRWTRMFACPRCWSAQHRGMWPTLSLYLNNLRVDSRALTSSMRKAAIQVPRRASDPEHRGGYPWPLCSA
jgi:hypothetical protein